MKNYSSALIASVSVVAMLVSVPVLSQELEEVIVTAEKRSENLQRVSLAVTAFTQERLSRIGANNVERLDALTPGLEWGQFGMSTKVSIRGQSTASSEANTDGSVALFIDGIYLGRGQQMWSAITDVERVEVLRGPQGTLFGRNSSGGSINIISRKPSREKEFGFEVTAGNYSHISTSGHFNFPLSDNLAARVSFMTEDHGGYLKNTFETDEDQMDEDMWYVRGALRYDEGPLLVDFNVDHYDQGGNGNAFSGAKFFDQLTPEVNTWADLVFAFADPTFTFPNPPTPSNNTTDWEIAANRSYRDTKSTNTTLTISYDFANMTLKSISGYSDFSQEAGGETDFHTAFLADCRLLTDATIFSQELQLKSNNADKLEWLVGLYYLDEEIDEQFRFEAPQGLVGLLSFLFGVPGDWSGTQDLSNRFGTATAKSTAIFGQATYSVTDQVRLTFGARYTEDDKTYVSRDVTRGDTRGNVDAAETFNETTWKVGIDYLIDDSKMIFATISTGFKSGGFNRFTPPAPPGLQYDQVFQPETIENYEIGFKGDMLDGTLRANVALYYNEIKDFQSYAFDDTIPTSITANAASAKTKGVELELTYLPSEPVQLTLIGTYLDAYYVDYATFSNGAINIDASGNDRELSPKWKFTIAASYDFDLGSAGTLTPYVQSTFKDHYFVTAANEPLFGIDRQDSYTQTDIKLIWNSLDRHWRGELFVQNIEDNFVKTGAFLATGGYWITYGPEPTLYGVKLSYKY